MLRVCTITLQVAPLNGTGSIFGKGMKRPKPGKTKVVFGSPMPPIEGESTRRFNSRIESAVATSLREECGGLLRDFFAMRRD